jgi:predicted membrane protein
MRNRSPQQRLVIGGFILIIGIFSLIDNLNIFSTRDLVQFWPMVLIVIGGLKITQSKNSSGQLIGGSLVFAGILMTLNHLGVISFGMHDFWPVFLIIGGLIVIFKDRMPNNNDVPGIDGTSSAGGDSTIDVVAVMSGNQGKNSSLDFRGGEITAIMGGVELDLRGASIQTEAVLTVFSVWGGIVLRVPSDWTIINNGIAIMAGIDDTTVPAMNSGKRLIVTGYAIMAGVEIKN